ncbi:cleavage and polyadenylation specificity factor subunit 1 isoform X2 [Cryptomeria japonica]|uniref:cleavage and polyadenylation specificity factor subunit 1 isoform X2 n=1 Tax=Cryptomeria japonica TaxID=3369 RepID=UPI0025ACD8AC|nr:cleavage and polyadenylation specificity factor subunit 1 isoform X2 [Cryptomeria japonica]
MSYAAFKMVHGPTGVQHCAAGYITHSLTENPPLASEEDIDMEGMEGEGEWVPPKRKGPKAPIPNLVVVKANVLEVYIVRVQEDDKRMPLTTEASNKAATMAGISGAWLEVVCHYRLHGNVESMAILSPGHDDGRRKRDAIILSFRDAKISVMEFDDSIHGLRTSSMHYFEGPEWQYLKRGREKFARGPLVQAEPQGRCGGVLLYDSQMIILKAAQAGYGLVGDDEGSGSGGTVSVHIESSYIVSLRDLDMKHVKDFTFIHGYIEPVMVILHEREPTWAGRLAWKHHTCMISAHSISMTLKQHPLIWSAPNLPHDAYRLLAVPSPIGGVIVMCANSLHYHSQSVSCALALNDFAMTTEGSSETPRCNFDVELDAAHATWISSDVALFSTKTGTLLLLSLVYDGRAVQKLELSKSKASVLASCISTVGDAFFFLGSRLGDSLLVQFNCGMTSSSSSSRLSKAEVGDNDGEAPLAKRLRRASSDISQDVVGEELSLYNLTPNNSDSLQKAFSFAVRDSLVNIGPLKDFASGLRSNADVNAVGVAKQSNHELVCCSGHGKNGSLCILQQSIRPELITEVELPGCKGIWTVYHKGSRSHSSDSSRVNSDEDEFHAYLIISLESRTMVLETADMLGEVTESVDYYVDGCTIAAGNLFGRRRVVQVYARGVRILDGAYMTQELCIEVPNAETSSTSDSAAVSTVSIADPYVLLKMSDGSIQLIVGDPSACTVSMKSPPISKSSADPIAACSLYHDRGPEPWLRKTSTDAWLSTGTADDLEGTDGSTLDQGDIYCIVCRESGRLDLFDVPNFRCVYSIDKFMSGKSILVDTYLPDVYSDTQGTVKEQSEASSEEIKKEAGNKMKVVEICMQKWSGQFGRPFLFAILTDGTMLCYHAYLFEGQDNSGKAEGTSTAENATNSISTSRLRNLRFVRVFLESMTRDEVGTEASGQRIVNFRNIGGYQGAFLTGTRPAWLMVCRERLRVHPQLCHGHIVAFTPLHNINCNHGLIYVTAQGFLKICQLPSLNYDNYWPVKKIPLRGTPHQITYFPDNNLYALIISFPVSRPVSQVLPSLVDQDSNHQTEVDGVGSEDVEKSFIVDDFEVRILEPSKSGGLWEAKASIKMQTSENAITVRMVTLLNTTTKENETFLAIGTAYVQGEDVAGRGRIILASVRQDPKNPDSWVTEVYSRELKGAISALAALQGNLLIASGAKIILHQWNGEELNGFSFYDAPHYVVSLNIVKTFILFGDVHKSIYFLNWKEEGTALILLAKDFGLLDCYATEFLIDTTTLSLVVSDDQKNIQIFYYAPKSMESWKGQKLLPRAEFHVGAHVTKFLRLQMLPTSLSDRPNRYALLCGTLDGSIGCIAPLDELTFRRLQTLQRKLVDAVPHVGGLNPRAFRQFRANGKAHRPGPDNIVDSELLCYYEMLPLEEQLEIANQIGTTRGQILNNLNDLSIGTSFL